MRREAPSNLGRFRRAARGRERAHRPRLGPGRAPARGDGQPGAARGLQRQSAEGHQVLDRARPEPGALREIQGAARSRRISLRCPRGRKIVENALRDFRLGGAELPPDKKKRYAEIQEELARLSAKFSENLLDATNAFFIYIAKEQKQSGIPDDVLQAAREAAQKDGKDKAGSSRCTCRRTCR